jgi:mono/diheme cytochrome c family protein
VLIHQKRRKPRLRLNRAAILAVAGVALVVMAPPRVSLGDEELHNPFANDVQAAQEGHELFRKAGCQPCHGPEAEGGTGPDLTDDQWRFKPTDEMLFRTITKGRTGTRMAAFGDRLTPDEVWKIIEFLRYKNRQRKARDNQER